MISPFHDASQEVRTFFYLIARFPFFFLPSSSLPPESPSPRYHHGATRSRATNRAAILPTTRCSLPLGSESRLIELFRMRRKDSMNCLLRLSLPSCSP